MTSKVNNMVKECKVHGLVTHNSYQANGYTKWRCMKCMSAAVSTRRRKLKELSIEYKGGMCGDCGYSSNPSALEFHHADPKEKEFGISTSGGTKSFDRIKVELDKCLLLCANCHREEHDRIDSGKYTVSPMGDERFNMFWFNEINS